MEQKIRVNGKVTTIRIITKKSDKAPSPDKDLRIAKKAYVKVYSGR